MKRSESRGDIRSVPRLVSAAALRALLYEVATSPKPGLVDRWNNGAHTDMDFFTFIDSGLSLQPYFEQFVQIGIDHWTEPEKDVFSLLQQVGRQAEKAMLSATGGVNTHRGAIFSLGLLCGAIGRLEGRGERYTSDEIFLQAGLLGQCSLDELEKEGAVPYHRFGLSGARGEAAQGFPHVKNCALPVYRLLREQGNNVDSAGMLTLLHLMAQVDDTNVAMRRGTDVAVKLKMALHMELEQRVPTVATVCMMDQRMIMAHISPGGCADLLAAAYFIDFWIKDRFS